MMSYVRSSPMGGSLRTEWEGFEGEAKSEEALIQGMFEGSEEEVC